MKKRRLSHNTSVSELVHQLDLTLIGVTAAWRSASGGATSKNAAKRAVAEHREMSRKVKRILTTALQTVVNHDLMVEDIQRKIVGLRPPKRPIRKGYRLYPWQEKLLDDLTRRAMQAVYFEPRAGKAGG